MGADLPSLKSDQFPLVTRDGLDFLRSLHSWKWCWASGKRMMVVGAWGEREGEGERKREGEREREEEGTRARSVCYRCNLSSLPHSVTECMVGR